jgi:AbrB family looped-hinge helix DNA binding protein
MTIEVKKLDRHGRIVIPKEWRERHGDEVVVVVYEDKVEILPRKGNVMSFVDSIEVEELKDWEEMRRELYEVR